jgi:mannosyl-3-phosphoglycerate phosphatase
MKKRISLHPMTSALIFLALDLPQITTTATQSLISGLQAQNIPIVLVSDQARAEIEPTYPELPLITENGGGIFIPRNHCPFNPPPGELDGNYHVLELGCPYVQARAGLRVLANALHYSLLGYGDLTVERFQKMMHFDAKTAQQAKAREFSEAFDNPKAVAPEALQAAAAEIGFQVALREQWSYLTSDQTNEQQAITQLIDLYQAIAPANSTLTAFGIVDHPNHVDMLSAVDIAIAIPGANGSLHPDLTQLQHLRQVSDREDLMAVITEGIATP